MPSRRSTLPEKPTLSSLRIDSSTVSLSHEASPDGWREATSISPAKPKSSPTESLPFASTFVRPGRSAENWRIFQPLPSGPALIVTERIVVPPAITAGKRSSTLPGIPGIGNCSSIRRTSATRSPSGTGVTACWSSVVSTGPQKICCPSALISKRGVSP